MNSIVMGLLALLAVAGCSKSAERSPGDVVDVMGTEVIQVERGAVSRDGIRSVAVDLAGFGEAPSIDGDRGGFLASLIAEVDSGNGAVVVWGADDDVIPLESADTLGAASTESTVRIIDPTGIGRTTLNV